MKRLAVLLACITMLFSSDVYAATKDVLVEEMKPVLGKAKSRMTEWLKILDRDLADAAQRLSATELKGSDARSILKELLIGRSSVVHVDIVDQNGKLITVEPVDFRNYEGEDIREYEHIRKARETGNPVLSSVFRSPDNVSFFALEYPIFSDDEKFLGTVNIVVKPYLFFGYLLDPIIRDLPCKIWVMQADGLVVYDPDPEQINKNIFTDPMFKPFPSLIEFSKKALADRNGAGSYDFYARGYEDKMVVKKDALWDTVGLYGTEWRVIVMEIA